MNEQVTDKWRGWGLLAVVMCLIWPVSAAAQQGYPDLSGMPQVEATGERDVAIVVAIDEYAFLPDVPGAVRNANDWELFFRRGLGVPEVHILTEQDAGREDILDFAQRATEGAQSEGRLWFVFIGHGAPSADGSDGLLVGMDARSSPQSLQARSVAQSELLELLEAGSQSQTILVVDACFSGQAHDGSALAPGTQPVVPVVEPKVEQSTIVLSAARADQFAGALPGKERPAFSYLLLGALRGWAAGDEDVVTTGEALEFVSRQLRGVRGRHQTPELFGDSDLVLTQGAKDRSPHIGELIARDGQPLAVASGSQQESTTSPSAPTQAPAQRGGMAVATPSAQGSSTQSESTADDRRFRLGGIFGYGMSPISFILGLDARVYPHRGEDFDVVLNPSLALFPMSLSEEILFDLGMDLLLQIANDTPVDPYVGVGLKALTELTPERHLNPGISGTVGSIQTGIGTYAVFTHLRLTRYLRPGEGVFSIEGGIYF